jgi:hypothetical protein
MTLKVAIVQASPIDKHATAPRLNAGDANRVRNVYRMKRSLSVATATLYEPAVEKLIGWGTMVAPGQLLRTIRGRALASRNRSVRIGNGPPLRPDAH